MKLTEVYTDGACFPNPGQGGWAWTTMSGESGSGHEPMTTNNRMELKGPIEAIKSLYEYNRPLLIFSDSEYVVKGINEWVFKWIERDWKIKNEPVKNSDLWQELHELRVGKPIFFKWIRGHSGHPGNEEADRLSVLASKANTELIKKCQRIWK